ncbi:MAG: NACHT domain-containing protein [Elainellaceae cyanobacterium]
MNSIETQDDLFEQAEELQTGDIASSRPDKQAKEKVKGIIKDTVWFTITWVPISLIFSFAATNIVDDFKVDFSDFPKIFINGAPPSLSQVFEGIIYSTLLIFAILVWGALIRFLKSLEDELNRRADSFARHLFERADNIGYWTSLNLPFRFCRRYYKYLADRCSYIQAYGISSRYNLDLNKVYVPLNLNVSRTSGLDRTAQKSIVSGGDSSATIWKILTASRRFKTFRNIIIIGDAGAGKTSLLRYLAYVYAANKQWLKRRRADSRLIPILISVRDVRDHIKISEWPDLDALVSRQESIALLNPEEDWFRRKLNKGRCLVLIDGLDEVGGAKSVAILCRWIDRQISRFPGNRFIITSRPQSYEARSFKSNIQVAKIQKLNFEQTRCYVRKWYLQQCLTENLRSSNASVLGRAELRSNDLIREVNNHNALRDMARTPLLLSMIVAIHAEGKSLPRSRVELYDEACTALLRSRPEDGFDIQLRIKQKTFILQRLALGLMGRGIVFSVDEANRIVKNDLLNISPDFISTSNFLKHIHKSSGLVVEVGRERYQFSHRNFQEYLAAQCIKDFRLEHKLFENLDVPLWSETIRLYISQYDATEIIWKTYKKIRQDRPVDPSLFGLLIDCLEECRSLDKRVRDVVNAFFDKLVGHPAPQIRGAIADIMLRRRINNMKWIDGDKMIKYSPKPITWNEYQLFLDESSSVGENYYPDHWNSKSYQSGRGKEHVVGIRASDAQAFCNWLTVKYLRDDRFVLPDKKVQENLRSKLGYPRTGVSPVISLAGVWIKEDGKYYVDEADSSPIVSWRKKIDQALIQEEFCLKDDIASSKQVIIILTQILRISRTDTRNKVAFSNAFSRMYSAVQDINDWMILEKENICLIKLAIDKVRDMNYQLVEGLSRGEINAFKKAKESAAQLSKVCESILRVKSRDAQQHQYLVNLSKEIFLDFDRRNNSTEHSKKDLVGTVIVNLVSLLIKSVKRNQIYLQGQAIHLSGARASLESLTQRGTLDCAKEVITNFLKDLESIPKLDKSEKPAVLREQSCVGIMPILLERKLFSRSVEDSLQKLLQREPDNREGLIDLRRNLLAIATLYSSLSILSNRDLGFLGTLSSNSKRYKNVAFYKNRSTRAITAYIAVTDLIERTANRLPHTGTIQLIMDVKNTERLAPAFKSRVYSFD